MHQACRPVAPYFCFREFFVITSLGGGWYRVAPTGKGALSQIYINNCNSLKLISELPIVIYTYSKTGSVRPRGSDPPGSAPDRAHIASGYRTFIIAIKYWLRPSLTSQQRGVGGITSDRVRRVFYSEPAKVNTRRSWGYGRRFAQGVTALTGTAAPLFSTRPTRWRTWRLY